MKYNFPSQKKLFKNKTETWKKEHLDWVEEIILMKDSSIRTNLENKLRNFRSYLGKISIKEYTNILNPGNLKDYFLPDDIQHYPIAVPYINVLIGEEFDRRFEWKAIVTNPNSISKIEETKRDALKNKISELILDPNISEEEAEEQLKNFMYYQKFEYQDVREKRANLLLKHFIKELDLKLKFNTGFKNVLLVAEEAYIADVVNGNPVIEVLDPKKTFVLKAGSSNRYEDADVIVIYDYWSPGQVQDRYYKYLKDKDVKWLDCETNDTFTGYGDGTDLERDERGINIFRNQMVENMLQVSDFGQSQYNGIKTSEAIDEYGNVRVIRLFWKSKKMIKRVKYYDEDGNPQIDYFSETYIPNKDRGEEVEDYWVNQWWEGVKVGKDIYPYIRPREIQYNKFSDPGYNHPGIVGQIYNTGNLTATSMMDRAMPYQLLYDATFHRISDALTKFFGSMPVVDLADIPEGWDIKKWLYFARKAGIAVKDSFKEGKKGASLGKMAGGISGQSNIMNQAGLGDYIQQQINILSFVETQMGRIIGVPPQRLGDIQNRETVGGVERAVTQSSFITNELFKIHDNVKKRVLTLLLETCKVAFKENTMKFQYIGDDYTAQIFEIDDDFIEEEFGILLDNETDLTKLEQQLENLTHAAMQNQMIRFSDVMKIYTSSSMGEKQRLIEKSEEDIIQRQEQQAQREQEMAQAQLQQQAQLAQEQALREESKHRDELALSKYKTDQDNLTKRIIAEQGTDGINMEDDSAKLELEYRKHEDEMLAKMKELDEKIRNNKAKEILESKKIAKMSVNKTPTKK